MINITTQPLILADLPKALDSPVSLSIRKECEALVQSGHKTVEAVLDTGDAI